MRQCPGRSGKDSSSCLTRVISTDFQNTQGIIFVIDSNDRDRLLEAREELQRMLNEDELRDAHLLVFANKQDLPNATPPAEITHTLGLHSLRSRKWVSFLLFLLPCFSHVPQLTQVWAP